MRLQAVPALMAAALLQSACATSIMPSNCKVTGTLSALPGMTEQAICDQFESDLAGSLATAEPPTGMTIALTLHKRGAIDARLSALHDGMPVTYPVVSVDAIDRTLQAGDLARLANVAAQVLRDEMPDQSSRPTAHHKGE